MSIEYTIDIQLTELGFPEIVPRHSSGRETSSCSISASQKQKVQQAEAAAAAARGAASGTAVRCKPRKRVQDEQLEGATGEATAGAAGQSGDGGGAEVEGDSGDSEASGVCEEEEEIDGDEDGLYSGMLWRLPEKHRIP